MICLSIYTILKTYRKIVIKSKIYKMENIRNRLTKRTHVIQLRYINDMIRIVNECKVQDKTKKKRKHFPCMFLDEKDPLGDLKEKIGKHSFKQSEYSFSVCDRDKTISQIKERIIEYKNALECRNDPFDFAKSKIKNRITPVTDKKCYESKDIIDGKPRKLFKNVYEFPLFAKFFTYNVEKNAIFICNAIHIAEDHNNVYNIMGSYNPTYNNVLNEGGFSLYLHRFNQRGLVNLDTCNFKKLLNIISRSNIGGPYTLWYNTDETNAVVTWFDIEECQIYINKFDTLVEAEKFIKNVIDKIYKS